MKSQKRKRNYKPAIIFFGSLAISATALAAIAFLLPTSLMDYETIEYFSTARVSSEVMWVLLALLALLPVSILVTAKALSSKKEEVIELEGIAAAPARAATSQITEGTASVGVSKGGYRERGETSVSSAKKTFDPSAVRFKTLTQLDEEAKSYARPTYDNTLTLARICELFRDFAAAKQGLYYDIADVRRFVASLGVSPILILQGMSGTGKTSLACAFGKFIHHDAAVVPVQPMWKERSDMLGYFNEFTERFNETGFLCTLYAAHYSEDMCLTVLDEMNIARVEYYFADFLSLLELPRAKDRLLTVTSEVRPNDPKLLRDGRLCIPENMWYIGTANNDDSTFAISDKVYDRAMILNLENKAQPFRAEDNDGVYLSCAHFRKLVGEAVTMYTLSEKQRENLLALDKYLIENFHVTFGNRIMKQLECYVPVYMACGGSEEAALDDMISQKMFRKLDTLNPVYVHTAAPGLLQTLSELFGEETLPQCCDYVRRLNENL